MEFRKILRNGTCRGCTKHLSKDVDDIFYTYSSANKGMVIIFCMGCVDEIAKKKKEYEENV